MDVVGDLLARDRRSREPALVTPRGRERTYHDLITNAYKAANVLRHLGARGGATVAIDSTAAVQVVVGFLGAARLGASVRFDAAAGIDAGDRVVLVPMASEPSFEPRPGTDLAVFGGAPERAATTHWEQELWSENPGTPPSDVGPDDPVVRHADGDASHRTVLRTATSTADDYEIGSGTRVVVRTELSDPAAVAAGVVAPLARGGVVALPGSDVENEAARGDVAVVAAADADPPESRRVVVSEVGE